jgi:hypothetical protein
MRHEGQAMRVKSRSNIIISLIATGAMLSATCGALDAEESTEVQRDACTPDVYRLCAMYIPSHDGITYCLYKNMDHLSPACRAVMQGRLK